MTEARSNMNPCEYALKVFICAGYANTGEVFNPFSGEYQCIPWMSLPDDCVRSYCTAVVDGGTLVVITGNWMIRYGLKDKEVTVKECQWLFQCWSSCPPVVNGRVLELLDRKPWSAKRRRVSLETGEELPKNG